MPKEIAHWIEAERIRGLVQPGPVREAIDRFPFYYLLGAVIFDSPFYAYGVANRDTFEKAALRLHDGEEGDTFEPFRGFFSSYPGTPPEEAISFISGAFTHYAMDVTFHPMVNYFSGKYTSDDPVKRVEAQVRHRTIEGLMDLYFSGVQADESDRNARKRLGSCLPNRGRYKNILKELSKSSERVDDVVGRLYGIDSAVIDLRPLQNRHGLIQRQFFRPLLSAGLNFAGKIAGGQLEIIAATFYPPARSRILRSPSPSLKFFAEPIIFTHPNTGEAISGSAEELAARAAEIAADLINGYQDSIKYGKETSYLAARRGLSLSYGCDTAHHPEPVHFNTKTPILRLCRTPHQSD